MSRRYLALWLPYLSTDRTRRSLGSKPDDPPLALVTKERGALRLTALDAKAAGLGLAIGMTLAEARSLLPALAIAEADPAQDHALLRACADLCERYTPLVALRGTDGLILDTTGCAHLFGGEEAMLRHARRLLAERGLTSRAAIAGTPQAAWAIAVHLRTMIVEAGDDEPVARALPIPALEQDSATTLALTRAGFRTLGDLADRPPHLLAARFGAALVDQLHRVLGREDIRITPLRPAPQLVADAQFPEPLAHADSMLAALAQLMHQISARLELQGIGGRAFEVGFFRSDGATRRLHIETAAPTREPDTLMRLAKLRMDALADPLDPGFGFDGIRLSVIRSEPLRDQQHDLSGTRAAQDDAAAIADLLGRLIARFGQERVRRFTGQDTHDPVRAGSTAPVLAEASPVEWDQPVPGQPPKRPLTLFAHPQPIDVLAEVPDAPPLRFRWRRVLHDVRLAEGPERIAPEWWRATGIDHRPSTTRDYYRVETASGHRFWIFRDGLYEDGSPQPRWFLHGLFA